MLQGTRLDKNEGSIVRAANCHGVPLLCGDTSGGSGGVKSSKVQAGQPDARKKKPVTRLYI